MGTPQPERLPRHITAWRFWKVDQDNTGFCLRSLVVDVKWPKGNLLHANCFHRETNRDQGCASAGQHQAPLYQGECGIYGYRSKEEALRTSLSESFMNGRIIGQVALAGVGIHHEMGYRSQYAYPLSVVAGACAQCREIIPLAKAHLGIREASLMGKPNDSTFVVLCDKHVSGEEAPFNWVSMLAYQYGIRVGGLHEFLTNLR